MQAHSSHICFLEIRLDFSQMLWHDQRMELEEKCMGGRGLSQPAAVPDGQGHRKETDQAEREGADIQQRGQDVGTCYLLHHQSQQQPADLQ